MDTTEALLRGTLATVARTTYPPVVLYKIVAPPGASDKELLADNLCDVETPQAEIGRKAKIDHGNLSRLIAKWVEAAIVIRVGDDGYPMHVHPLTKPSGKTTSIER